MEKERQTLDDIVKKLFKIDKKLNKNFAYLKFSNEILNLIEGILL